MLEIALLTGAVILSAVGSVFACLTYLHRNKPAQADTSTIDALGRLLRAEGDATRRASDDQSRGVRQELAEGLKNFQDSTVGTFKTLGDFIDRQIRDFGERLDAGVRSIDEKVDGVGKKLNEDLGQMESEAHKNRDALRSLVDQRLMPCKWVSERLLSKSAQAKFGNFLER